MLMKLNDLVFFLHSNGLFQAPRRSLVSCATEERKREGTVARLRCASSIKVYNLSSAIFHFQILLFLGHRILIKNKKQTAAINILNLHIFD